MFGTHCLFGSFDDANCVDACIGHNAGKKTCSCISQQLGRYQSPYQLALRESIVRKEPNKEACERMIIPQEHQPMP